MLPPAPRPRPSFFSASTLLLVLWIGLLCWIGALPAEAKHFLFKDYHGHPHLTPPDQVKARAVMLMDANTGEILYQRNPQEHLLPASTTKLMTALIVFEKIGFNGAVTVVPDDRAEPSNVPLIAGETVSVHTLFYALLIESANDTARALGRHVAGSVDGFVDMMNARARAMHLSNTHFYNPNGLPAPAGTHYTCCADLMQIFRAVLTHPELRTICSTKAYTITTRARTQTLHNHNRLLGYYPGMGAAKTGWTVASRHTYAASVRQGNRELLLTLLDSPNKWADAQILFNWGFAQASNPADVPTTTNFDSSPDGDSDTPLSAAPAAPVVRTQLPTPATRVKTAQGQ